jgi:hypothetical protein
MTPYRPPQDCAGAELGAPIGERAAAQGGFQVGPIAAAAARRICAHHVARIVGASLYDGCDISRKPRSFGPAPAATTVIVDS